MRKKRLVLSVLLLCAILLPSCAPASDISQDSEDPGTLAETTEMVPDPLEALRTSGEEWIGYGLRAYEEGRTPPDFREFFSNPANMTYLTLYDHFFTYDPETSVPVAEALFRFILETHGADAVADMDKRIEYKSEFLQSLGLDMAYTQTPEVEYLLASMELSSDSTYSYIISFDNVTYYFKDFGAGSPTQYHGFLYFSTTGLFEMIEYLKTNHLSESLDTERDFRFYMTFDGSGTSRTVYANGNMFINDGYSTLHEAMHAMGITDDSHIWMSEGICTYFGKMLGFHDQVASYYIQMMLMAKQGYFDERASAGDQTARMQKQIYEEYTACGGKMDHVDHFDYRLFFDIQARLEQESGSTATLGAVYKALNKKTFTGTGGELTYSQSGSLTAYLADIYGIEKVMEAYRTQDVPGVFGKSYEELKTDWQAYLAKQEM